jgi:hypothetical protein
VRAYLDVVAPDLASWEEIHQAFLAFLRWKQQQPLPWRGAVGPCRFRFNVKSDLLVRWQRELAELYESMQYLHLHFTSDEPL